MLIGVPSVLELFEKSPVLSKAVGMVPLKGAAL